MRAEVPVALLPAHRRRVERRQERRRRLGRRRRLEVAGEDVAGRAVEVDLLVRDRRQRRARLAQRPARPPAHVRLGRGPKAASQRRSSSACAAATSSSSIGPPSQSSVVTQRNCGLIHVPRGRPAHEPSLHRHLRQHARTGALLDHPPPRAEAQLLREQRHVARDLGRHRLAARGHGRDGCIARTRDPGARPGGDAAVADEALEALALRRRDRLRRRREDDRQQLARHGPQRPPHREQADEAAVLVERGLDVGRRDAVRARLDGEEDRDRVGRMQADERARDVERVGRPRRRVEPVAHDEPRPPLVCRDRVHGETSITRA